MSSITVRIALLVGVVATAGSAWAQEDAGIVQKGDRQPRGEIVDMFDEESERPDVTPGQLLGEGWAAYNRGLETSAAATEADEKKRKKLERRAAQAFEEGERRFTEALQLDGELVEAYVGLARTWSATGETEKTLQAWGEAYRRTPQNEEVLVGLGEAFMAADRARDAASVYPQIEEHAPDAAVGYLEQLRLWGAERAENGDEEAEALLAWIDEQG